MRPLKRKFSRLLLLSFLAGFAALTAPAPALAKFIQLDGVADVKTRFSDGCSTVEEVTGVARSMGIDVVIFSDHARDSLEFGLFPFERIFKKTQGGSSVLSTGAAAYLAEINELDRKFEETLLIPALEVAPFYYWSGNPLKKNLVAHDWGKHLLIVGLQNEADYRQIPILNSNSSTRYVRQFQNTAIGLAFLFLLGAAAVYKKFYLKYTVPFTLVLLLLTLNNHPFRSSPFDQYQGSQGTAPYQEVIDYANSKGALVFWNHMESLSGIRELGSVKLDTPPYPQNLLLSAGYTGFQAVTGEPGTLTEPGKEWDRALLQYIQGLRDQPVWGYGGNDFHCDYSAGPVFGSVRTVFLVRTKSRDAILDAMKNGRMYAVRQPDQNRLSLDEFALRDPSSGKEATLGETLVTTNAPEINIKVRATKGGKKKAAISLIRNGEVVKKETAALPYDLVWKDAEIQKRGQAYYRVIVEVSSVDYLVSNPVFVRFADEAATVVSLPPRQQERPKLVTPAVSAPAVGTPAKPKTPAPPQVAKVPAPVAAPVKKPPAKPTAVKKPVAQPPPKADEKYMRVLTDGVSLKKGPAVFFPDGPTLNKGDRLLFVRRTSIIFNDKAWLVVKHNDRLAYVWEGMVEPE